MTNSENFVESVEQSSGWLVLSDLIGLRSMRTASESANFQKLSDFCPKMSRLGLQNVDNNDILPAWQV